jgi:spore maturation protein CgeB
MLAKVKKALGSKCRLHGLTNLKKNVYFNLKYGFPGWPRPIAPDAYVGLYQRTKIGFNVHNRGKYTVGGYRLFDLPANGVMQISDGGEYLQSFFEPGSEVIGYDFAEELIDKIFYYLEHENERIDIAIAGFRRAMQDHRLPTRMQQLRCILEVGMNK